ncbi:MAG: DMT family transporter, partial [Chloroflexota bacterium]
IINTTKSPLSKSRTLPYIALTTGILALSLTAMFVRWADAPATITGFYRLLISSLLLLPIFVWRNFKNNKVTRQNLIFPILGGLFTAFDLAFWNSSVLYTTASNATLLGNTAPIWVALVTMFLFRNKLPKGFWLGLALALGGAALVLGNDFFLHPRLGLGDLMAITAGFFYAGYLLSTQRGRESLDPLSYITIMVISASLFTLIINLVLGHQFSGYSQQSWLVFILLALVSQILGYMTVSYALGHLPASIVAPTMIGQPILTTLLAIPLLGELPQPVQLVGGLVTLAGIYLVHNSYNKSIAARLL